MKSLQALQEVMNGRLLLFITSIDEVYWSAKEFIEYSCIHKVVFHKKYVLHITTYVYVGNMHSIHINFRGDTDRAALMKWIHEASSRALTPENYRRINGSSILNDEYKRPLLKFQDYGDVVSDDIQRDLFSALLLKSMLGSRDKEDTDRRCSQS